MIQVFISHSKQDQEWVRDFAEELANQGIKAWLAENEIQLGETIADKLEEGLRGSDAFVIVVSPESVTSMWASFELGAALGAGKKLIAVVDKDVPADELPGPIRIRRYLDKKQARDTAKDVAKALLSA